MMNTIYLANMVDAHAPHEYDPYWKNYKKGDKVIGIGVKNCDLSLDNFLERCGKDNARFRVLHILPEVPNSGYYCSSINDHILQPFVLEIK